MKEIKYVTPHKYSFTLSEELAEKDDTGNFIIYYNGEKKSVPNKIIEFGIQGHLDKLSVEEFGNILKGTKGITAFSGDFKDSIKEEIKMDNKYYTPDINEIYVGFELDVLLPQWKVQEFRSTYIDTTYQLDIVEDLIKQDKIRVKYLDEEDIESCGFNYYKTHPGTTLMEFEYEEYSLIFDPEFSSDWNCTISFDDDHSEIILFHGYIKNKSELKKVLKMIGVEYEK